MIRNHWLEWKGNSRGNNHFSGYGLQTGRVSKREGMTSH